MDCIPVSAYGISPVGGIRPEAGARTAARSRPEIPRAPTSAAAWQNRAERWECSRRECIARYPSRSNLKVETRAHSRLAQCVRCKDSKAQDADAWDPIVLSRHGWNRFSL